ncbi:M48 family metallopeptidase [Halospina sp. K52047b]|jgi:Zn-dependent protease with chaperone function|uniref:M48 family metallopeptidase n=1 Tax=Halospina sp. K52047b TaxID=2614160 RepID=UPI00124A4524|nr:M48 family metallopeptidase [Halospina sp. K52047b]KAA8983550.1 M48 family metallopeptidase [Halospina sp. K52047b]
MRFFERQDRARRQSLVLILLFLLAVSLIILAVSAVLYGFYVFWVHYPVPFLDWLLSEPGWAVTGTVAAIVAMGSLYRYADLRRGGERVARMAGARPVPADTAEKGERQLRNVTEEMALASGVTVPQLFVMDQEAAINAFVAGYQPNEAVLVVTRGTLDELSRDELQGVVAHEFSHILNGDMRINVRLISMLAGILLIGQLGQYLVRFGIWGWSGYHHRRRYDGALVLAGAVLVIVGYVGLFMGRVIKSAVSRQREYLADAAAVQFTRNPEGIGGALYRIGVAASGSRLRATSHAEDLNHLCFGESVSLARLLASHPPIEDRLNAIDETLLVRMKSRDRKAAREQGEAPPTAANEAAAAMGFSGAGGLEIGSGAAPVGALSESGTCHVRSLLAALPGGLNQQLHGAEGAVHLCLALALEEADHGALDQWLPELEPVGAVAIDPLLVRQMIQTLRDLGPAYRVPLVELSLPALRELETPAKGQLLRDMEQLIREDRGARLHDIAILGFLKHHLGKRAGRNRKVVHRRYGAVMPDIRRLLWLMASAGTRADPEPLYREAMAGFETEARRPSGEGTSARKLLQSLGRLDGLPAMLKPAIIDACVHCIQEDGRVSPREYELLRIIADQLDCPMPPLPPSGESGPEQG